MDQNKATCAIHCRRATVLSPPADSEAHPVSAPTCTGANLLT